MAKSKLKKFVLLVAAVMVLAFALGIAAACDDSEEEPTTETFTVTFYDGTTVITTREVEEGGKVAEFTPADVEYTKDGYTFGGWYATADFTFDWSFDTAIERDTNVYSLWTSSAEDTRQWTIAGSSSAGGPLAAIGWNGGPIEGPNGNILTKTEGKNEFTITIDLYVGDQFQFCIQDADGVWNTDDEKGGGARGGQYLVENEYMSAPGTGLGDGQVNITVSVSGNYTLTLTTDAEDKNVGSITVVRNGDAPEVTVDRSDYTWYIYGNSSAETTAESVLSGTNWGANVTSLQYSAYEMFKISANEADGTGTWTQTWTLAAGDEFLLAYCTLKDTGGIAAQDGTMFYYPDIDEFNGEDAAFKKADGMGSNIVVVEGGTYTFTLTVTLNSETNTLEGSIAVEKTADLLTADQAWKVLGGRLSYAQATDPDTGNLTIDETVYNGKTSVFANNNFGVGTTVQQLTAVGSPAAGMAREYEITLELVEGDYFYFCIPMAVHAPYREDTYYTPAYTSKLAVADSLPEGVVSDWAWGNGGNLLCTQAGSYTFRVSVTTGGALSLTVTAAQA